MEYKQLSLFLDDEIMDLSDENVYGSKTSEKESTQRISDRLMEGFDYMSIPFLGCDFDRVYPAIGQIIPQEPILFDLWGQDVMLMAELVCVGICHQMNWDFLRNAVFQKLKPMRNPSACYCGPVCPGIPWWAPAPSWKNGSLPIPRPPITGCWP